MTQDSVKSVKEAAQKVKEELKVETLGVKPAGLSEKTRKVIRQLIEDAKSSKGATDSNSPASVYKQQLDELNAEIDIQTSENRRVFYSQEMIKAKNNNDTTAYNKAKTEFDKADRDIKSYNSQIKALSEKYQASLKLEKVNEDRRKAQEKADFYKNTGQKVPEEVQNKISELTQQQDKYKKTLGVTVTDATGTPKPTTNVGYVGYKGPANVPTPGEKTSATLSVDGKPKGGISGDATPKPKTPLPVSTISKEQKYSDAIAKAQELYQMPDIIFKNVPSLNKLLQRYINDELTLAQFQKEVGNDIWYRQNSQEIKNRYIQKFNFDDLVKSGQATGTTDYEQSIARITQQVQAKARQLGASLDSTQAQQIAEDLYIFNQDANDTVVTNRIATFIRPSAAMVGGQVTEGYSGQALKNYQGLQAIAKANGFKLDDILPKDAYGKPQTAEQILQGIAKGTIDTDRLQQDVRKLAALGQPQYVRDLLGQGYDLETIYSPYKQRMSQVLELNPDAIDLRDPTLRMAISDKGDMNLFDYERSLRKDSRWQYTQSANDEVSTAVLGVLRDFGFRG